MEVEFTPVEPEDTVTSYCTFCMCFSLCPSTWRKSKMLYPFACLLLSIISFISLCVCIATTYILHGFPTHSSSTAGIWTSFIGLFISSYSSYVLYFNKELHSHSDKASNNMDPVLNQRKKRSWCFNFCLLLYFNVCALILIICGALIRPLCLWYCAASIPWYISTLIAGLQMVYTKNKYNPMQYQHDLDEVHDDDDDVIDEEEHLMSDKDEPPCFQQWFQCCCLHCLSPLLLMLIALLLVIQACFAAHAPNVQGQLYTMQRDGFEYKLQAICKGKANTSSSTIVLMHDQGFNSLSMQPLQSRLEAGGYRSCTYTRPGFAWSDARPLPLHDDNYTVDEMFDLLQNKMGEQPPFVLIGHSVAGQLAKYAAYRHRQKVAGIVLLDSVPSFEWQMIYANMSFQQVCKERNGRQHVMNLYRYVSPLGVWRPFSFDASYGQYAQEQWWAYNLDSQWNTQWLMMHEQSMRYQALYEWEQFHMQARLLNDMPLLSIAAGLNISCEQLSYRDEGEECTEHWRRNALLMEMHVNQAQISSVGELKICPYPCGHASVWTQPRWVFHAIDPYLKRWSSLLALNSSI